MEEISVDGKVTATHVFREVTCEGVDWIGLAQDRYK
jgi:hypothetical protein